MPTEEDMEKYGQVADRYLLRHETANKAHYEKLHPAQMSFDNRMRCLRDLKDIGYQTGCGFMVGSPYQTARTLAEDLKFIEEFRPEMCGIGPFIPHPDTPLKDAEGGTLQMALKVMALTRLLLPDINIPATTAMETLVPEGQTKALQSGANVLMPNITLTSYRQYYELYPGKTTTGYTPDESLQKLKDKILSIGRIVGSGAGASRRFIRRNNG